MTLLSHPLLQRLNSDNGNQEDEKEHLTERVEELESELHDCNCCESGMDDLERELDDKDTEIEDLKEKLKDAEEVIFAINNRHFDDKTHIRFIEDLKKWKNEVLNKVQGYKQRNPRI